MNETIGKRIAFHRKRLSLTQDALAEQLGVTAQAVSKWENDQSCPDISMLPRLAEIFQITTDELLGVQAKEVTPLPPPIEEEPQPDAPSFRRRMASSEFGLGLWLFFTGAIYCLMRIKNIPPSFWEALLAAGILTFGIRSCFRRLSPFRLGCAAVGTAYLLEIILFPADSQIFLFTDWSMLLTVGIMLLGLDFLIRPFRRSQHRWLSRPILLNPGRDHKKNVCTYEDEWFRCELCFGSGVHQIQLPRLSGGRGEVSFGQLSIDLSPCTEIAPGCHVELDSSFGSLEVLVPRRFRVESASSSAFGNVQTLGTPEDAPEAVITMDCDASFGEITIRYV